MTTATEAVIPRPFHETIVDAIKGCHPNPSCYDDIFHLFELIRATKIPKGHDEIIAAIDEYFSFEGAGKYAREIGAVKVHLREQQRTATRRINSDVEGIDLDDFQQEIEKLLALLKDRQLGLHTWHEFVHERLQNLHRLASLALGK